LSPKQDSKEPSISPSIRLVCKRYSWIKIKRRVPNGNASRKQRIIGRIMTAMDSLMGKREIDRMSLAPC
jgi:hypothetical protein